MRGCLAVTAKILAVFFAILFVIVTALVLFTANLEARLFKPETYKHVLQEQNIYHRLPLLVAKQLVYSMNYRPCAEDPSRCEGGEQGSAQKGGGPPIYFKNLTLSEWENLLSELISPAWIQVQAETVIDQLFNYLNSDQQEFSLVVSLAELKRRLGGEEGLRVIMGLIRSQPTCSLEQLVVITEKILSGKLDEIPICRPPDEILNGISPLVQAALSQAVLIMPDEVDLASNAQDGDENGASPGSPGDFRNSLRRLRQGIHLSLLLPVVLILLVTLFGVRSLNDWLLWWGIPLLITGLLLAGMALTATMAFNLGFTSLLNSGKLFSPGIMPDLVLVVRDLVSSIIQSVVVRQIIQAGLISSIGLVMIIISLFVKPKERSLEI